MSQPSVRVLEPRQRRLRMVAIFAPLALAVGALPFLPSFAQDPTYHEFADQRTVAGIPYFGDVITSFLLTLVGLHGLWVVFLSRGRERPFADLRERRGYVVLFAGIALTGLGSAYYHWDPTTTTLFWDRLPMTMIFAPLFTIAVAERIGPELGRRLLLPALVVGVGGVVYWHLTELYGAGDVRLYGLV